MHAYLNAMRSYADFSGRTSRPEFWRAHIVLLPLMLIGFGLFGAPTPPRSVWPIVLFVLIVAPHAGPWAALVVRRLHDMDQIGWWALVGLIPLFMILPLGMMTLLIWACRAGSPGPNSVGDAPIGSVAMPNTPTAAISESAPDQSRDLIARLERLVDLKASGALSAGEFDMLKAKALAQAGDG